MPAEEQQQVWSFLHEREAFQETLTHQLLGLAAFAESVGSERLNFNFRLLQVCDALSLYACLGQSGEKTLPGIARREWTDRVTLHLQPIDDVTVAIQPYPFNASPVETWVTGRELPAGPFRNNAELREVWEAARELPLRFRFRAP